MSYKDNFQIAKPQLCLEDLEIFEDSTKRWHLERHILRVLEKIALMFKQFPI